MNLFSYGLSDRFIVYLNAIQHRSTYGTSSALLLIRNEYSTPLAPISAHFSRLTVCRQKLRIATQLLAQAKQKVKTIHILKWLKNKKEGKASELTPKTVTGTVTGHVRLGRRLYRKNCITR